MLTLASSTRFSRRHFGRLVALALAVAGIRQVTTVDAAPELRVFRFDPNAIDAATGKTCRGCAACRRHAAHKLFASFEAADARRAHPNCRCAITAVAVSRIEFEALFGSPETGDVGDELDLRWRPGLAIPAALRAGGLEMPAGWVR